MINDSVFTGVKTDFVLLSQDFTIGETGY